MHGNNALVLSQIDAESFKLFTGCTAAKSHQAATMHRVLWCIYVYTPI